MAERQCPECGGKKFKIDQEGYICMECGLVISESYYFEKIALK